MDLCQQMVIVENPSSLPASKETHPYMAFSRFFFPFGFENLITQLMDV